MFSGGGFAPFSTTATVSNGWNVKVDYLISDLLLDGDHNGDGLVNAIDYVVWRNTMSHDIEAYNLWKQNYGRVAESPITSQVPEPTSVTLLTLTLATICWQRRFGSVPA